MSQKLPPLRRLVTGIDSDGKSCFTADEVSPMAPYNPNNPNFYKYNVWATGPLPTSTAERDRFSDVKGICPIEGGTVLHVIDFPPEPKDPAEREQYFKTRREDLAVRMKQFSGVRHDHESKVVGMHETDSIDYAIVLSGEIYAILEKEEKLIKAGDVMIQRGTNHGWSNRSDAPCRMAFVVASAKAPK